MLVNRGTAIRHEIHATAWGGGAFAEYNGFLAALDARYFTLWATYHARPDRSARSWRPRSGRARHRRERVRLAPIARAGLEAGGARCEGTRSVSAAAGAMACGDLGCYDFRFLILPNVPIVQRPRTWPFQGQNAGSNPAGDAT